MVKVIRTVQCWLCGQGHIVIASKGKDVLKQPCSECGAE